MTENGTTLAERRAALLQAAAEVGRVFTSILDPDQLLRRTVDIICERYGFYYAGIFLLDESREWAVLKAGFGEPGAAMVAENHKLEVGGSSMIGAATAMGSAVIALDVGKEPVHFKNPHLPDTRSEMALPLIVGSEVIGALTVQSVEESAFSEDDINSLQAMADQLAVAINNARLHDRNQELLARAKRRARLLKAAAEVGRSVTSILDMDQLLPRMVDIVCEAYDFYYAGVFLLDESGEWAVLRAGYGEAGAAMVAENHKLKIGGPSMIGAATAEGEAHIELDVEQVPEHFENPHLPNTRSEMALPLRVGDEVIGALTVQSERKAAFTEDDITSLQAMADQLAVAIDNARLLQALESAHAELLRTKTFEAIANATTEAIHWIGNKALPISTSAARLRDDLASLPQSNEALVDSMREDLQMIEDSAELIVSVQEHLIGPAREEKPRPAMATDVIKDAAVSLGIPAEILRYEIDPDVPLVQADTTQLRRAFAYGLRNALEAVERADEQQITVQVERAADERFVAVRIADTGPGIPEEDLDRIWAAFYTTKGHHHAGLGLSATLQILRQIGGQVRIANRLEGGTMLEMLIPALDQPPEEANLPAGLSCLIVDDADAWRRFAAQALRAAENSVTCVRGGSVPEETFDLILLDDVLEDADGLALAGAVADRAERVIVVATSLRVERTMALVQAGADDVVLKPYTPATLAALIEPTET